MFPKRIASIVMMALLTACAAPTASPAPSPTTTPTFLPTETPTPAPTATSTPEPTATPEPTVVQKEITFDLSNGGTLSMPAFFANIPENVTPEEIAAIEKETLETALQFIVDEGVDWTRTKDMHFDQGTQEAKNLFKKLTMLDSLTSVGAFTVPYGYKAGEADIFLLGFHSVTYNETFMTLLTYYTDDGGWNAMVVEMNLGTAMDLIKKE